MWYSSIANGKKSFSRKGSLNDNKAKRSDDDDDLAMEKRSSCQENLHQYLLNSTLHGLRYVGERQISPFERAFFMLSFIFVVLLSAYFITNVYEKWNASPVIIAQNAYATSISEFPFPAVTICNLNQVKKSKIEYVQKGTIESMLVRSICQLSDDGEEAADYQGKWSTFRGFLINVSQPCSEMLMECKFATETQVCMELFNTVLTDDGLCCTFNSVHPMFLLQHYNATDEFDSVSNTGNFTAVEWTPEDSWKNGSRATTYPRAAAGPGSHMGLSVILEAGLEDYYCSSGNSAGFKILLHNPTETPKISDFGFSIALGQETRVVITPRLSDASPLIRSVHTEQRQCIFANEANLTYYRTYSRKNCEMECEARIVEEKCGCVQFYMPRMKEDTDICSQKDYKCSEKFSIISELGINQTYSCNCLPGCFEISYKPSVYISELGNGSYLTADKALMSKHVQRKSVAVVHIYYEESYFRSFTKEELIGFTEFLSNTGGLLGLFMGFSVVSIIEIIYFVSLRPYCASRRNRNKNDRNIKIVQPSRKVWFVDEDRGKLDQLKPTKNAWDATLDSGGTTDRRYPSKSDSVGYYPYRD
ncbi:pickpocket protein 28 [Bradysia coprophila]|uniref:pickpocket protein 28 n=1 Tax=Bradysia coprophila TaxID=38358 RepID=UPI00187D74B7|nr:pickpocket protein 28 [Bradysia coprophila]